MFETSNYYFAKTWRQSSIFYFFVQSWSIQVFAVNSKVTTETCKPSTISSLGWEYLFLGYFFQKYIKILNVTLNFFSLSHIIANGEISFTQLIFHRKIWLFETSNYYFALAWRQFSIFSFKITLEPSKINFWLLNLKLLLKTINLVRFYFLEGGFSISWVFL